MIWLLCLVALLAFAAGWIGRDAFCRFAATPRRGGTLDFTGDARADN